MALRLDVVFQHASGADDERPAPCDVVEVRCGVRRRAQAVNRLGQGEHVEPPEVKLGVDDVVILVVPVVDCNAGRVQEAAHLIQRQPAADRTVGQLLREDSRPGNVGRCLARAVHGHRAARLVGPGDGSARREDVRQRPVALRERREGICDSGERFCAAAVREAAATGIVNGADRERARVRRRIGHAFLAVIGEEIVGRRGRDGDVHPRERREFIADAVLRDGRLVVPAVADRHVDADDIVRDGVGHNPLQGVFDIAKVAGPAVLEDFEGDDVGSRRNARVCGILRGNDTGDVGAMPVDVGRVHVAVGEVLIVDDAAAEERVVQVDAGVENGHGVAAAVDGAEPRIGIVVVQVDQRT